MAITVIVCDDHPVYARGLAVMLEHEDDDIQVVAVTTKAEHAEAKALDLAPDVVLMDIRMPVVDGIEGTRRLVAASPLTKVIVLTASDEPGDLYQALRAGACGYVVKDAEAADIARTVRSVWAGQLVIPSHLAAHFATDLDAADPAWLSLAERDVLTGAGRGETSEEMAQRLGVPIRTMRRRVEDIYAKLHLSDRITGPASAASPARPAAARPASAASGQ
jgi:DNA-binding NarL/FixJ family response regulator